MYVYKSPIHKGIKIAGTDLFFCPSTHGPKHIQRLPKNNRKRCSVCGAQKRRTARTVG